MDVLADGQLLGQDDVLGDEGNRMGAGELLDDRGLAAPGRAEQGQELARLRQGDGRHGSVTVTVDPSSSMWAPPASRVDAASGSWTRPARSTVATVAAEPGTDVNASVPSRMCRTTAAAA